MIHTVHHLIEELRAARIRQGLTQRAVSRRSGVSPSTIAKWERGAEVPRLSNITAYAQALDLKLTLTSKETATVARATTVLPADYPKPRRKSADHYQLAAQMRAEPGVWVLVSEPDTREAAHEARRRIKSGLLQPYRKGGFDAEIRRSITGRHEVWAQYTGGEN